MLLIGLTAVGGSAQASPAVHAKASLVAEAKLAQPFKVDAVGGSDAAVVKLVIGPGGSTGWHMHHAAVLVMVDQGTASFYYADDPRCQAHRYHAGQAVSETPGRVHITRNEGGLPLVLTVVFVVSPGGAASGDAPRPGNCAF